MKWGILGCANIAKTAIIPAIQAAGNNTLIAVASRQFEKAENFASLFQCEAIQGYDQLLGIKDIDAVYIPLPTGMHYEWVIRALNAGKHVLVEKSAAENYEQAKEMVELAKIKGLALVENFQFQFHSQHQKVFEMLESKVIGDVRSFRSSFGFPPFDIDDNIRYDKGLGGGSLLDAGAYVLKATSFILGNSFEVKSAFLSKNKKYDVDWYGGAFLVDDESQIFSEVAFGFDNYYQCNYEIWGSKGKITSTRAFTAKPNFEPLIILEKGGRVENLKLEKDNHFVNMVNHFNEIVFQKKNKMEYDKILHQAKLIQDVFNISLM